jgi:HD-GYP domain-containing protein (c-di-GMP phosphodiesterase class II)
MPRLSELIRKPNITLELSQLAKGAPYIWESDQQLALPNLDRPHQVVRIHQAEARDNGPLVDVVEKEFVRLAADIARDETLTLDGTRAIALRLVQELHRSDELVAQVFAARPLSSRLVSNALNVAVLVTKLGMGLRYSSDDLLDVATVALLHDVDQLVISTSFGGQTDKRGSGTRTQPHSLPAFGCPLLNKLTDHPWLAEVAGQAHERWDGQGTPHGLKGAAIHEYAQIIGLADRFETLINAEGLTAHEAMRRLLTKEKMAFRGSLLKILVQQISLFPVGTVVRLNTGEMGTVEQTNPQHPLRPIVRLVPGDLRAVNGVMPLKDLSQDLLVHIEKAIRDPQ